MVQNWQTAAMRSGAPLRPGGTQSKRQHPGNAIKRFTQGDLILWRGIEMCGIVGILGRGPVAGQLVESLKRLEYRGYDSAGLATLENGHLARRRAEGKLKNLENRLSREPLS